MISRLRKVREEWREAQTLCAGFQNEAQCYTGVDRSSPLANENVILTPISTRTVEGASYLNVARVCY